MNKAGRPSVPARIKELSGTLRKDRAMRSVEFQLLTIAPKPEVWMDSKAKKYFKNICELLIKQNLLNVSNVQLVILMAQEFSTYETASRKLKGEGMIQVIETKNGAYDQVSPWVSIRNQALKNYKDLSSLFGLDPLSCQKIGPAKGSEEDPFDKMQKKYNGQ